MTAFLYSLGYQITVPGTKKTGVIVGRAEFFDKESQYCLEWIEQTGAAMRWFTEPELTGSVSPTAADPILQTTLPPESSGEVNAETVVAEEAGQEPSPEPVVSPTESDAIPSDAALTE